MTFCQPAITYVPRQAKATPQPCRAVAREATAEEVRNWDQLVARFKNGRIVHRAAWIHAVEASVGATPVFFVFEKNGRIAGCLPGLLARMGPLRLFGSPLPGWQTATMGPAFDTDLVTTTEIMTSAIALLEGRYNVHHVELINGSLDHEAMRRLGFRSEPIPTYRAPLVPGNPEAALKQLKESARRNVRRAIRLGLRPRFETEEAFVDQAYDQITEVFARGGNVVPFAKKRVLEFFRHMEAGHHLLAISVYLPDADVSIATGIFTIAGDELMLWQWAHRTKYRWYRPTELMTWTVMKRAMEVGCTTFDLMGEGEFKTKFGAQRDVSQYRWVRSRYRWLTELRDIAEKCYRWQQSARGRIAQRRLQRLLRAEAVSAGLELQPGDLTDDDA